MQHGVLATVFHYNFSVALSGPEDDYFEGFFVQCRLVSDDTTRVGVFASTDANSRLSSCPVKTVSMNKHRIGRTSDEVCY